MDFKSRVHFCVPVEGRAETENPQGAPEKESPRYEQSDWDHRRDLSMRNQAPSGFGQGRMIVFLPSWGIELNDQPKVSLLPTAVSSLFYQILLHNLRLLPRFSVLNFCLSQFSFFQSSRRIANLVFLSCLSFPFLSAIHFDFHPPYYGRCYRVYSYFFSAFSYIMFFRSCP